MENGIAQVSIADILCAQCTSRWGVDVKVREFGHYVRWFLGALVRQFVARGCLGAAAALTFTTLVAVVPFMAVVYRVLSLLPGFDGTGDAITRFIFRNFVAGSSDVLLEKMQEFSANANELTLLGLLFVFATTLLMVRSVEQTFNAIWGVPAIRRGGARFFTYWGVVTLGVPLVGVAVTAASYDFGLSFLADRQAGQLQWLPPTATAATFALLYYAVPSAPVRVLHAVVGGVVTAAALEGAKVLFGAVVPLLQHQFIYGAFAVLPLFLAGVYLLWALVLAGAALVHTMGMRPAPVDAGSLPLLMRCLAVVRRLSDAHGEGRAVSERDVGEAGAFEDDERERVMEVLEETGVARLVAGDESSGGGRHWVLGRSLRGVTLWELCQRLPDGLDGSIQGDDAVAERLRAFAEHVRVDLGVNVEDLLARR